VLAVLVLAAITLVTLDSRAAGGGILSSVRNAAHDAFSPLQQVTHDALRPIGNFLSGAVHYGSLRKENQKLRDEIASMQSGSVQANAEMSQAEQVLGLQHLPFVGQIPTVDAAVIDQGADNFETTVTIDKGRSSGIAVGQPVVAAGGLVGTVVSAGSHQATIALLTDFTFTVGVRLDAANTGSATGSGRGQPLRVVVDTTTEPAPQMSVGQSVVTSGLQSEKFPPNIPVGRVAAAALPPGAAEPAITLAPFVDLNRISVVAVLLWSPQ